MFESILLGLIQGLTEFLPVSSSGHLVLMQNLLDMRQHRLTLDIAVHLGTALSVITIYIHAIKKLFQQSFKTEGGGQARQLLFTLFLASLPTALIGLGFKKFFTGLFHNLDVVGVCFIFTGVLLFLTRKSKPAESGQNFLQFNEFKAPKWWQALIIGIAQGAAIAPGISRSGTTIAAGLLLGIDRKTAAFFSFLLSLPAILGASLIQALEIKSLPEAFLWQLILGIFVSYLAGLCGLWAVLNLVKRGRLEVFSLYLWGLGTFTLLY